MTKCKQMSKREIYAQYGIEFKDEKILSPLGWIREPMKEGNGKREKLSGHSLCCLAHLQLKLTLTELFTPYPEHVSVIATDVTRKPATIHMMAQSGQWPLIQLLLIFIRIL